jgi:hypothetical protein
MQEIAEPARLDISGIEEALSIEVVAWWTAVVEATWERCLSPCR